MDYCWPGLRNVTALGAALFAASLVVGCGNETGVLVEVTRDPSTTPDKIEKLEFIIGLSTTADPATFLKDSSSIQEVAVDGRELKDNPYHLLVREGGRGDAKVMVAVLAYKGGSVVGFAGFDQPQGFISGQVLMRRLTLIKDPAADVSQTGCVTWVGPDETRNQIASVTDEDCDGDVPPADCDDHNPAIGPSRTEVCANQIDDNCNGMTDEVTDDDHDGFTNCAGDCQDNDAQVHPGATEVCDGKDNDCNTRCDDGVLDGDNDKFNTCGEKILADGTCLDIGKSDCKDSDPQVNPGATEICNGKDDDCNGDCDIGTDLDRDGDGLTDCGTVPGPICVGGQQMELEDCKDMDPEVHPGAAEICDGKDDNCDGVREFQEPCYVSTSGQCRLGTRACDDDDSDGAFGLDDACLAPDGSPVVADGFCTAYHACDSMVPPPDDRFACANAMQATANKFKCDLFFKPDFKLCPELRQPLPIGPPAQNCRWQILGGLTQTHYKVGLFDAGGGGGPQVSLTSCTGAFGVVDKLDFLARPDSIYMEYSDDSIAPTALEVRITPMLVATCPAGGGLHCTLSP